MRCCSAISVTFVRVRLRLQLTPISKPRLHTAWVTMQRMCLRIWQYPSLRAVSCLRQSRSRRLCNNRVTSTSSQRQLKPQTAQQVSTTTRNLTRLTSKSSQIKQNPKIRIATTTKTIDNCNLQSARRGEANRLSLFVSRECVLSCDLENTAFADTIQKARMPCFFVRKV